MMLDICSCNGWLAVVFLTVSLLGCPGPQHPDDQPATWSDNGGELRREDQARVADQALLEHQDFLESQPGVVFVGVGEHSDGSGRIALVVGVCNETFVDQVVLPQTQAVIDVTPMGHYHGEDAPVCACEYNGELYAPGDTFPAGDGCNECRCHGGMVSCTLLTCEVLIHDQIFFSHDTDTFSDTDLTLLDTVASTIAENQLHVRVEGHANADETDPEELSQRRAHHVRKQLIRRGVPRELLPEPVGHGASRPITSPNDEREKGQNRRVEFRIAE